MISSLWVLLVSVSVAFAAHGCHHNHHGLTEEDVIEMVMDDMDHDKNGYITTDEFTSEFVIKFDRDGDNEVSESEFVKHWHLTYHDSKEFAARVYGFLGNNGALRIADAPKTLLSHDVNGDGQLSFGEFKDALLKVYHNCA